MTARGRGPLAAELAAAKERISELTEELNDATSQITEAEETEDGLLVAAAHFALLVNGLDDFVGVYRLPLTLRMTIETVAGALGVTRTWWRRPARPESIQALETAQRRQRPRPINPPERPAPGRKRKPRTPAPFSRDPRQMWLPDAPARRQPASTPC